MPEAALVAERAFPLSRAFSMLDGHDSIRVAWRRSSGVWIGRSRQERRAGAAVRRKLPVGASRLGLYRWVSEKALYGAHRRSQAVAPQESRDSGLFDGGLRLPRRLLNKVANFFGVGEVPLPGSTTWFRYRASVWSLTPSADVR